MVCLTNRVWVFGVGIVICLMHFEILGSVLWCLLPILININTHHFKCVPCSFLSPLPFPSHTCICTLTVPEYPVLLVNHCIFFFLVLKASTKTSSSIEIFFFPLNYVICEWPNWKQSLLWLLVALSVVLVSTMCFHAFLHTFLMPLSSCFRTLSC